MRMVGWTRKNRQFLLRCSCLRLHPDETTEDYSYQTNKGSAYQKVLN